MPGFRLVWMVHDKRLERLHFGRVGRVQFEQHKPETVPDASWPRSASHLRGDRH